MTDLAAIDRIEYLSFESWFEAARPGCPKSYRWELLDIAGARCSVCASDPSILMNRVFGLGSQELPTIGQLAELRRAYADAGIDTYFVHLPHGHGDELIQRLTEAGFERYRGWMKFTRDVAPAAARTTDLDVRAIGPGDASSFAAIAVTVFGLAPDSEPAVAALPSAAGWTAFMSFADGHPAGTGALFTAGNIGSLDWGATRPEYRRRGSQGAILGARLQAARAAGCDTVVTMTGEAVPGEPQQSYSNILRAGFAEAYLRENWIPA